MNSKPTAIFILLATLGTFIGVHPVSAESGISKPNIVLIFADDLGFGDLSCYGATKIQTPNIDRLATAGMKFTDAHSAASLCSPSRYGLLTGRAPWRLHRKGNGFRLNPGQMTLAMYLKNSGYTTAAIGKWHLGYSKDWNKPPISGPLEVGFDYHFGVPQNHNDSSRAFIENHDLVGRKPGDIRTKFKTAKADAKKRGHVTNGPWRDGKGYSYEGGHRVPFIARWPGQIEAASSSSCTITMTDLFATAAEVAEQNNIAGDHPEIAKQLALAWQKAEADGRTRP